MGRLEGQLCCAGGLLLYYTSEGADRQGDGVMRGEKAAAAAAWKQLTGVNVSVRHSQSYSILYLSSQTWPGVSQTARSRDSLRMLRDERLGATIGCVRAEVEV